MSIASLTSRSLTFLAVATCLFVLPCSAIAQLIRTIQPRTLDDGTTVFVDVNDNPSPQLGGDQLWDNWTSPSRGGATFITTSMIRPANNEVGETCIGVPRRGGMLSDIGFGVANLSSTQSIQQMRITNRVYSMEGALLMSISSFAPLLPPAAPGELFKFQYGEGAFLTLGIEIPDNVICTVQITELGDFDPANLGLLVGSPMTAGAGDGMYYNRSLNQMISLPSNQENLLMKVHTLAIPSPTSFSLFAASSLLALSRRRAQDGR